MRYMAYTHPHTHTLIWAYTLTMHFGCSLADKYRTHTLEMRLCNTAGCISCEFRIPFPIWITQFGGEYIQQQRQSRARLLLAVSNEI